MSASLDVAARGTHNAPTVGLRTRMRSAGVWIVGVAVVLLTVIVTMLLGDDGQPADPLHFDSTRRDGTKALIETARDHGTQVSTTEDAQEAREASAVPGTTRSSSPAPRDSPGATSTASPRRWPPRATGSFSSTQASRSHASPRASPPTPTPTRSPSPMRPPRPTARRPRPVPPAR